MKFYQVVEGDHYSLRKSLATVEEMVGRKLFATLEAAQAAVDADAKELHDEFAADWDEEADGPYPDYEPMTWTHEDNSDVWMHSGDDFDDPDTYIIELEVA